MKHTWLNKSGNSELVIFFAGWSFDAEPFKFLAADGIDVVVVYDYRDLSFDLDCPSKACDMGHERALGVAYETAQAGVGTRERDEQGRSTAFDGEIVKTW